MEDDDAPSGSGIDVSSTSLRSCFAALSSSGSGGGLSCTSGLSDVLVASRTVSDLAFESADLGGGSQWASGIAGSGAFQTVSFVSPAAAFGGLPLVVVSVGVRVPAQRTLMYELCLAFPQMCSRPSCQNQQLSKP